MGFGVGDDLIHDGANRDSIQCEIWCKNWHRYKGRYILIVQISLQVEQDLNLSPPGIGT